MFQKLILSYFWNLLCSFTCTLPQPCNLIMHDTYTHVNTWIVHKNTFSFYASLTMTQRGFFSPGKFCPLLKRTGKYSLQQKKESCKQDSPPAAGRFCGIIRLRYSAILAERFSFIACIFLQTSTHHASKNKDLYHNYLRPILPLLYRSFNFFVSKLVSNSQKGTVGK